MILRLWLFLIGFLLLSTASGATTLTGECSIRFFGDSTLHGFEGQARCEPFSWQGQANLSERSMIRQAIVRVPVAEMDTDNSSRDKKMFAMFESEQFPIIQGLFGDFNPDEVLQRIRPVEEARGRLGFDLTIRDITQPIEATVRDLEETPEQITFIAEFPVSLSAFQLKAPGVLGIIRVADEVRVEVEVVLHMEE